LIWIIVGGGCTILVVAGVATFFIVRNSNQQEGDEIVLDYQCKKRIPTTKLKI
jgi:hypothetical protein